LTGTLSDRAATIMARCDELATHSEEPDRLTRSYGTPALRAARDAVAAWMTAAGLAVRTDALGNLYGRLEAVQPETKTLLLGSHLDSVRDAGRYDGPLGVLTALAAVEGLAKARRQLPFAVEVVAFADEEGLRFPTVYLGSRALTGMVSADLLALRDAGGITLAEAIRDFGGDPAALPGAQRDPAELLGYVEVHIEQGPVLEREGLPIGVVSAIAGQSRFSISLSGVAGHAGTIPMALRHDALCAAAEVILAIEELARATPGLVATVGQLQVEPGASNVVPGQVTFSLDLRHALDTTRRDAVATLEARASGIAAARAIELDWRLGTENAALSCDSATLSQLAGAITAAGFPVRELVSGAGHDAVMLSRLCPVAMLFVRCAGGISHNPAESVTTADVSVALDVLDRYIAELATTSG